MTVFRDIDILRFLGYTVQIFSSHRTPECCWRHPERGILKTDISNAFNCVSRCHLLEEVASHFPEIHTNVRQMYGVSSPLLYFNGKSTSVIVSEEGVQQGDTLGTFLFALSIHPGIDRIQSKIYNDLTILVYLDDIFVIGHTNQFDSLLNYLRADLKAINLKICDRKCEIYLPSFKEYVKTASHFLW